MFRKNVAGQFFCFQGVDAATGGIKSGVSWAVRRCIDGTFAAAGGTVTEDGSTGWYKFAMTQDDTNGNDISFNFTGTGAVPQTVNILTTACNPSVATNFGITALNDIQTRLPAALVGGRMDASVGALAAATGLAPIHSGTAQADNPGAAGSTLLMQNTASAVADFYRGSQIRLTGGTGAGQVRWIENNDTGRVVSVIPDWATNPDTTTTYAITGPISARFDGGTLNAVANAVNAVAVGSIDPAAFLDTLVMVRGMPVAATAITIHLDAGSPEDGSLVGCIIRVIDYNSGNVQVRVITAWDGDTLTATVDRPWNVEPTDQWRYVVLTAQATYAGDGIAPTVGQIATAVWQDATAGDFAVASSIGKSLYTAGVVPGNSSGLALTSAVAAVQSDVDDIQTRLPAALVGGRMDASVGACAANSITDAAIAVPVETAGRPSRILAMIRRLWEWQTNKRTRDQGTGVVDLLATQPSATILETQTQATVGDVDSFTEGS